MTATTLNHRGYADIHLLDYYRDSFAHLTAGQRREMRKEYRHLRICGLNRFGAKRTIFHIINVMQGWD